MQNTNSIRDDLIDKKTLSKMFGRTPRWVEMQVASNDMPCIKISPRTVRYRLSDISRWMNSKKIN